MSYEDDEYWDDEYSDQSPAYADNAAVAPDRYSSAIPPARRPRTTAQVRTSTWDGEIEQPLDLDVRPEDELAARRKKRSRPAEQQQPAAPTGKGGFDSNRPDWLNDPEFVPTDTSVPDPSLADVVDFNRPELGANFDNPEYHGPEVGTRAVRSRRDPEVVDYVDYDYDDDAYAADVARFATDQQAGRDTDFADGLSSYKGDRPSPADDERRPPRGRDHDGFDDDPRPGRHPARDDRYDDRRRPGDQRHHNGDHDDRYRPDDRYRDERDRDREPGRRPRDHRDDRRGPRVSGFAPDGRRDPRVDGRDPRLDGPARRDPRVDGGGRRDPRVDGPGREAARHDPRLRGADRHDQLDGDLDRPGRQRFDGDRRDARPGRRDPRLDGPERRDPRGGRADGMPRDGMRRDPRLGSIDPRLGSTGPRLGGTDPRLGGTDPRLGSTDPRLAGRDPRVAGVDPRVAGPVRRGPRVDGVGADGRRDPRVAGPQGGGRSRTGIDGPDDVRTDRPIDGRSGPVDRYGRPAGFADRGRVIDGEFEVRDEPAEEQTPGGFSPIRAQRNRITVEGMDEQLLDGPISGDDEAARGQRGLRRPGKGRAEVPPVAGPPVSSPPAAGRAQVPVPPAEPEEILDLYRRDSARPVAGGPTEENRPVSGGAVGRARPVSGGPAQGTPGHPVPGGPGQATPGRPAPGGPGHAAPSRPASGDPAQHTPGHPVPEGPGQATPGRPVSGGPVSGGPVSGGPVSGGPVSGGPVSGGPGQAAPGGRPQEDAAAAWEQRPTSREDGEQDADGPRVISKAPPPTTPRVISKADPPAAPRVIKKAEPPAAPRVVGKSEPTASPRVVTPAASATQPHGSAATLPDSVAPPTHEAQPGSQRPQSGQPPYLGGSELGQRDGGSGGREPLDTGQARSEGHTNAGQPEGWDRPGLTPDGRPAPEAMQPGGALPRRDAGASQADVAQSWNGFGGDGAGAQSPADPATRGRQPGSPEAWHGATPYPQGPGTPQAWQAPQALGAPPASGAPRHQTPQPQGRQRPEAPQAPWQARWATPQAPERSQESPDQQRQGEPAQPRSAGPHTPPQPHQAAPDAPDQRREAGPQAPGPQGPGYAGPQASGHAGPQAPGYAGPQAPGHVGPQAPGHAAPQAPSHVGPQAPGHAAPQAPSHAGPQALGHAGPQAPGHAAPQAPSHAGPQAPSHAGPQASGYAGPQEPGHAGSQPYGRAPQGPGHAYPGAEQTYGGAYAGGPQGYGHGQQASPTAPGWTPEQVDPVAQRAQWDPQPVAPEQSPAIAPHAHEGTDLEPSAHERPQAPTGTHHAPPARQETQAPRGAQPAPPARQGAQAPRGTQPAPQEYEEAQAPRGAQPAPPGPREAHLAPRAHERRAGSDTAEQQVAGHSMPPGHGLDPGAGGAAVRALRDRAGGVRPRHQAAAEGELPRHSGGSAAAPRHGAPQAWHGATPREPQLPPAAPRGPQQAPNLRPAAHGPAADGEAAWNGTTPAQGTALPDGFAVRQPAPDAPPPAPPRAAAPEVGLVAPAGQPAPREEAELRIPRYAPPGDASEPADGVVRGERPAPPTPVTQPIGRLVIAGPDTEPRRYVDADLKIDWFGKGGPEGAGSATATDDGQPPAPAGSEGGRATAAAPAGSESGGATAAPAETPAKGTDGAPGDGVLIDLDISGLFDGRGVTAEQAMIVARESAQATGEQPAVPGQAQPDGSPANGRHAADQDVAGTPAPAGRLAEQPIADDHEAASESRNDASEGRETAGESRNAAGGNSEGAGGDREGAGDNGAAAHLAAHGGPSAADLAAIRWRLDGGTLREVVDDREALQRLGEQLDGPLAAQQDDATKAGLLSVRAEVYRLLGELGMAAAASRLALEHAERTGESRSKVIAQAELAHVLRLRGDFAEADRLFEEAASSETPETLRSVVHENAGRSAFDQGRHMEALDHFARAVRLGDEEDMDLVERVGVSLEAIYIHVLRDGWGPYPRMRREIIVPEQAAGTADPEQGSAEG